MSQPNHTNNTREFNAKDQEYCKDCEQEIELCECEEVEDDSAASLRDHMQDMDDIICEYSCNHLDECDCFNSMASDFLEARARVKELEEKEKHCATMDHAEKMALYRGFQELCSVMGVSGDEYNMPRLIELVKLLKVCEKDPTKCPQCAGEPDNGFDRCMPPNAYCCTKCEQRFAK